jgi:L-ascorbate metabolism protein UlaG (beta-lactamase superfamily)
MSALELVLGFSIAAGAVAPSEFQTDVISTSEGDLRITFIGHGTLMLEFGTMVIHVDPVGRYADYSAMPKADLILVTHEHGDHLDKAAIASIATDQTALVLTEECGRRMGSGHVMNNGDVRQVKGLRVEAVPAYNIVHMRGPGQPFHPKGTGNGYVISFGDKRVYIAGDTENVPEMARLKGIDCAFLPMNVPYTMTPEMVAEAAKVLKPRILYPYHFGETDTAKLVELLENVEGIEVRIRNMK